MSEIRARLAEALKSVTVPEGDQYGGFERPLESDWVRRIADALTPVVEALAAERTQKAYMEIVRLERQIAAVLALTGDLSTMSKVRALLTEDA